MRQNLVRFYKDFFHNFIEAVINLFIFFPYFFSLINLLKTLFSPWKNLITKKTTVGFSFSEWFGRVSFNLVSCSIGFLMRMSLIIFFFLLIGFYLIILPFVFILYLFSSLLLFLLSLFEKTEDERKQALKQVFIAQRLGNPANTQKVLQWFEEYYNDRYKRRQWWKLDNLLSYPPLARDWSVGFTPLLDQFSFDLTDLTHQTKIRNVINRNHEIEEIERILAKSENTNALIVGEEGVGKHTIVDALSKKMYEGKTVPQLLYKRILKLDMEKILNSYIDTKQREHFFEELLKEAQEAKNIIIFIDDIDRYVSPREGGINLAPSIEKMNQLLTLQIIAITTPYLYQQSILPNEKISRLFSKVDVYEIAPAEAEKVLLACVPLFETRYQVVIPYETVKNAIEKSDMFLTYIPFPEKAVELMDSACEFAKLHLRQKVTPELVDAVILEKTHVPANLTTRMKQRLVDLENLLSRHIFGQDEAIGEISKALRRAFLLLGKRKKPLASFIFFGPTGVGKTETAKTIAEIMFDDSKLLNRFDMSIYQLTSDIPKLIGSQNGTTPGLLTKALRENPYGVLLIDEIEKAHKDLLNIFLTLLDEGYIVDGMGKRVDAKNLVIIATSNAGSDLIYEGKIQNQITLINYLIENHVFSPEFLNRFDGLVLFKPLAKESVMYLAKKVVESIAQEVYRTHNVRLAVSDSFISDLIQKGYDQKFGARNLERVVRAAVEDSVAKQILADQVKKNDIITL